MSIEYKPRSAVAREIGGKSAEVTTALGIPFIGKTEVTRRMKKSESQQELQAEIADQLDLYQQTVKDAEKQESSDRNLQPGNSVARVFTLRTKHRIWFRPSVYRLQIEIEYSISSILNLDTIEHQIQVRSSLMTIILGALTGALGGWIVREGATDQGLAPALLSLGISGVLGMIAVVIFARKKDVQPFIAVEDFWGGVAIGFAAAYTGTGLLDELLPATPVDTAS